MGFAQARAQVLGYTARLRVPEQRSCLLCGMCFVEDSLPVPLIKRLGVERLKFCAPCLQAALFSEGLPNLTRDEVAAFVRDLADAVAAVPSQSFGSRTEDLLGFDDDARVRILRLLRNQPSKAAIERNFGTWFDALVASGVLATGARRNARGIQCHARDGHICYSLGEKTIDDYFAAAGLAHEREPRYPESNMRADFLVGGVFVEYFGLSGDPDYDAKTSTKLAIAANRGIDMIAVYPRDLASVRDLEKKLGRLRPQRI